MDENGLLINTTNNENSFERKNTANFFYDPEDMP